MLMQDLQNEGLVIRMLPASGKGTSKEVDWNLDLRRSKVLSNEVRVM
jgi:hypothetical protein